jgi:hypothetical protein
LKQWPKQFISGREVCRRAGGKWRFRDNPYWATEPLLRLVEKQVIESDSSGHFRIRQKEKREGDKKWISPELKKILEESGKTFDDLEADETEEV